MLPPVPVCGQIGLVELGEARLLPFRYRLDAARITADCSLPSDEQVALDAAR